MLRIISSIMFAYIGLKFIITEHYISSYLMFFIVFLLSRNIFTSKKNN